MYEVFSLFDCIAIDSITILRDYSESLESLTYSRVGDAYVIKYNFW